MKLSKVASVIAALIATDAKPTEAQIMAACLAADKKGKDEGGLGPVEIEEKDKAKDKKGKDEKDDPEKTNDEWPDKDDKAKDEKDDEEAKDEDMDAEDDEQPKESVTGAGAPAGNKGKEPAKDKKGMDARINAAIRANDALHAARRDVEPIIGVVTYDSAGDVYRAALKKLGVTVDGVDASAFPAMFKMAREKIDAQTPVMASDAAAVKTMAALIPGYGRLK